MRATVLSIFTTSWLILCFFPVPSWSWSSSSSSSHRIITHSRLQPRHPKRIFSLFNSLFTDDDSSDLRDPTIYDGDILPPDYDTSIHDNENTIPMTTDHHHAANNNNNNNFIMMRPEEEENDCLPPGRMPELKLVFLVSDATGVTARSTLLKSLAQFDSCSEDYMDPENNSNNNNENQESPINGDDDNLENAGGPSFGDTCDVRQRMFTFIRSPQALRQILKTAQEKKACVMYTIADPELRRLAGQVCASQNVPHVDLMGPSLQMLSQFLHKEPLGIPSRLSPRKKKRSYLGDQYYSRINAVEFTLKADDGQSPWLLPEADIVLVGVSRSGKTPLSVVLSQTMSLKVANIPLVVEVPPPKQLLEQVDPRRVFCLTIAPSELRKIRTNRLERRGVKQVEEKHQHERKSDATFGASSSSTPLSSSTSNYADRSYLLKDLKNARQLSEQYGWAEVDVTGRAVEETATSIMELFSERFVNTDGDGDYPSMATTSNQHIG